MSRRPPARAKRRGGSALGKWAFRLGLIAFLYVLLSAGLTWHLVASYRGGMYLDPAARGIEYQEVEWSNERGQTIRGYFAETPDRPTVILAHGHRASRGQLSSLFATLFLHCRFGVLAFDFRGCGESDGHLTTAGIEEAGDLKSAIDFLTKKEIHEKDIGLVAFDMGGVAALNAVERIDRLGAVVIIAAAETPQKTFERRIASRGLPLHPTATLALAMSRFLTKARLDRPDVEQAWRRLREAPVLLIAGEADEVCPPGLLQDAFRRLPGERKRIEVFAGLGHDDLVSAESPQVLEKIRRFLVEQL